MVEIKTDRLVLRPAKASDVSDLFAVYSNAEAMRYWDELPHAYVSRTQGLVDGIMQLGADTRYFVIDHKGRAIGTAGFWRDSEVGYILHPDMWRQGLGGEVLRALIRFGFDHCGFDHITADVDPDNAASLRMLGSAGFVEIGRKDNTLQVGDKWVGSVYLRLEKGAEA